MGYVLVSYPAFNATVGDYHIDDTVEYTELLHSGGVLGINGLAY